MNKHGLGWRGLSWCLLLLLFLSFVACRDAAVSSINVRLACVNYPFDLPTLVAEQKGIFERDGLNVEVTRHDEERFVLEALKEGRADFALMSLSTLVLEQLSAIGPERPEDPVILASLIYSHELNQVLVKASGAIREPSDMEGRRVGLGEGSGAEYFWWLYALHHGIDTSRVSLVDVPHDAQPDVLLNGEVQALVTLDAERYRIANYPEGKLEVLAGNPLYADNWVLVTTRDTATRRQDISRRVLQAYHEAIEDIQITPNDARKMYLASVALDPGASDNKLQLPPFGMNLDWSLLFNTQQLLRWTVNSEGGRHEPQSVLNWIESAPLRDLMPSHVGIPPPLHHASVEDASAEEARTP
ncbi:ABC transporter substrate-binding protein [Halomonas aquatica]|uniref:ABC transporter substrate-binding protein n=1 Tax=Halomonas aquatica TaxID=3151123 RepID=A0ABV1NGM2_9GAMM